MCLVVQRCDIAVAEIVDVVRLVMTDKRMKHLLHEVFMPQEAATGSTPASGDAARGNDTHMVDSEPGALAPSAADGSLPAADAAPPATDDAPPAVVSAATESALPMPVAATVLPLHATNAASSEALVDGLPLAPAVQAAPSSSLVLPSDCFVVSSKNAYMYGKKMRDVDIAGFSVQIDEVVRFRSSDGKVAVADILVGVGKHDKFEDVQEAIYTLIGCYDVKIQDLESLEVDLDDEQVCDC